MKQLFTYIGLLLLAVSCSTIGVARKSNKKGKVESLAATGAKAYDRLITSEAISKTGLFDVHKVGDKYYFEIPDSLFNREMLVVTRFIKTPSGGGNYGGEKNFRKYYNLRKRPFK
ncbi:DUF5118 domain-containing protein [Zobellia nedashkovskayae]